MALKTEKLAKIYLEGTPAEISEETSAEFCEFIMSQIWTRFQLISLEPPRAFVYLPSSAAIEIKVLHNLSDNIV